MWERDGRSNRLVFASHLRRGTKRVVVSGRLRPGCGDFLVKIFGRRNMEIPLLAVGLDVSGACNLPEAEDAELRIETSAPPTLLACWSFTRIHPSDLWHRTLPASLVEQVAIPRRLSRLDCDTINLELADRGLGDVLSEVGTASLGGGSEELIEAAITVLEYLDCHPLHRTNALGAFIAALCQPQSAE
jgi:hypothetical protein